MQGVNSAVKDPLVIPEYRTTQRRFKVSRDAFAGFKAFCESSDESLPPEKRVQKLKIKDFRDPSDGTVDFRLKATSYVGVFSIPQNVPLIVTPKIRTESFVHMLQYIDESNLIIQDIMTQGLKASGEFVDLFLGAFLNTTRQLLQADLRRGYSSQTRDLPHLKGRVHLPRTVQNFAQGTLQLRCSFHSFDLNTPLLKYIKYTLHQVRGLVPAQHHAKYAAIRTFLAGVDLVGFHPRDRQRIHFHRLNQNYKPVIDLCDLLLKNQLVTMALGARAFPAFCFNSWNVFEAFTRKVLQTYAPASLAVFKRSYTFDREINPDVVIEDRTTGAVGLVIDVKYKRAFNRNDYYQVRSYLSDLKCPRGVLLYPRKIKEPSSKQVLHEFFSFKAWERDGVKYLREFARKIFSLVQPAVEGFLK